MYNFLYAYVFVTLWNKIIIVFHQFSNVTTFLTAGAMVMKQQLQKEQVIFKSKVEELQLRLTSPTHTPSTGTGDNTHVGVINYLIMFPKIWVV